MVKHLFFALAILLIASCAKMKSKEMSPLTLDEGNLISDMWDSVSKLVDSIYNNDELTKDRERNMNHNVDSCHADIASFNSFAEMQNYFVIKHLDNRPAQIQFLAGFFDTPADINKLYPTSLISHNLCPITKTGLIHSITEPRLPDDDTILKLNEFSNINNKLRKAYLAKNTYENKLEFSQHWAKLVKCLSYIESLTTADTENSKKTALQYAPVDYRKPAGVAFYIDPVQTEESKLNIGTYQFDPDSEGNVRPCIREWNQLFPQCGVSLQADEAEMIRTMGSEIQAFNIFCGINKLSQMFSVQVNSSNPKRTHIDNNINDNLKAPKDRCVSFNFHSSFGYNHFGPFQNSSGKNLKELMSCYFE